jgi:hypothetical protein
MRHTPAPSAATGGRSAHTQATKRQSAQRPPPEPRARNGLALAANRTARKRATACRFMAQHPTQDRKKPFACFECMRSAHDGVPGLVGASHSHFGNVNRNKPFLTAAVWLRRPPPQPSPSGGGSQDIPARRPWPEKMSGPFPRWGKVGMGALRAFQNENGCGLAVQQRIPTTVC